MLCYCPTATTYNSLSDRDSSGDKCPQSLLLTLCRNLLVLGLRNQRSFSARVEVLAQSPHNRLTHIALGVLEVNFFVRHIQITAPHDWLLGIELFEIF